MGSDSYRNGEDSKDIHGEDRDFRWRWGNLIGSAGWNYLINRKLFATFTGGYTRYRSHIIQKQNAFVSSPDKSGQIYFQEGHYRSAMEDMSLRASLTIARMSTTGSGWEAITCSIFFVPNRAI